MSKYNPVEAIKLPEPSTPTTKAYTLGYNTAIKLDSGSEFLGAIDEADKVYTDGASWEHGMFIAGYIQGINTRFPNGTVPCTFRATDNVSIIQ